MDLGIAGRKAIVCGSSRGLGRACAVSLAAEGVDVVINGRDRDSLAKALDELRTNAHVAVTGVVSDITTHEGRAALLAACPDPDILITNSAGPQPGAFYEFGDDTWLD